MADLEEMHFAIVAARQKLGPDKVAITTGGSIQTPLRWKPDGDTIINST
jgi:hypothetical protein